MVLAWRPDPLLLREAFFLECLALLKRLTVKNARTPRTALRLHKKALKTHGLKGSAGKI